MGRVWLQYVRKSKRAQYIIHVYMTSTNSKIFHNEKATICVSFQKPIPGCCQPYSQAITSIIPRPSPALFPGHRQPYSQAITSIIPRSSPALFPGHRQPCSQAIASLIPRPSSASFLADVPEDHHQLLSLTTASFVTGFHHHHPQHPA